MSDILNTAVSAHDKLMFKQNVRQAIQQGRSHFSPFVHPLEFKGKKASYDDIGTATPHKRKGKYSDTKFDNIDHYRRWMYCGLWDWAELITEEDKLANIHDPTNDYVLAANKGFQRLKDDIILEAMFADVEVGEEGEQIKPWNDDYAIILPDDDSGLTLEKLHLLREHIELSDVDDDEQFYIGTTSRQMTNLMETTEVKSSDYNSVKVLVRGEINQFMGFNFVRSNRILWKDGQVSSGVRRLPVWAKSGIGLAVPKELQTKIDQNMNKNYLNQIWCSMNLGALRRDEKLVLECQCKESLPNRPQNL